MSKLLDELNKYKETCLDDDGYSIENTAEHLVFKSATTIEEYEKIIHAIANIDTVFMLPDGTDREWDDKEALEEIEKLVKPVWDKECEYSREKTNEMFKGWGLTNASKKKGRSRRNKRI